MTKQTHALKAKAFLADSEHVTWHDQAIYLIRQKRDALAHAIPEWEALRTAAEQIKQHTITHLAHYLEEFERNATANGAIVHWAADAEEMNRTVLDIIKEHGGTNLVKSKSMLAEECGMSPYLEANGIDAVETDLGERIMQFLGQPPSHIVMPAIHVKREAVSEILHEKIGTEKGNCDPTYLSHAVRAHLRQKFLHADISMTGGNFAVAESGAVVVCTNEGNADMGTAFPDLHIAIIGIEKVVPNYESLGVFTRLLARSGTGQPITSYTAHYRKPENGKAFHIVLVDNGRSEILNHTTHAAMLRCLRCGSCMNTCPVYRRSGGYSYSYFIPGPLGVNLAMLRNPDKYAVDMSACSLCYSCSHVCPAKIPLAEQIYQWRQQLYPMGVANKQKHLIVEGLGIALKTPARFKEAVAMGRLGLKLAPRFTLYNRLNGWGISREMPTIAPKTFEQLWREGRVEE